MTILHAPSKPFRGWKDIKFDSIITFMAMPCWLISFILRLVSSSSERKNIRFSNHNNTPGAFSLFFYLQYFVNRPNNRMLSPVLKYPVTFSTLWMTSSAMLVYAMKLHLYILEISTTRCYTFHSHLSRLNSLVFLSPSRLHLSGSLSCLINVYYFIIMKAAYPEVIDWEWMQIPCCTCSANALKSHKWEK